MNQAHSGPYYAQRLEPRRRVSGWTLFWIILGTAATHYSAFLAGGIVEVYFARQAAIAQAQAPQPAIARPQPEQILGCSSESLREWWRTCKARERNERIRPRG